MLGRWNRLIFDGPDKSVASSWNGFYVDGLLGRVSQDFAKLSNRGVKSVVGIDKGPGWLESSLEFLAGNYFFSSSQKQKQDFQGLILHANAGSVSADLARARIDFETIEPLNGAGGSACHFPSTDKGQPKRFACSKGPGRQHCSRF